MKTDTELLSKALGRALSGKDAHVELKSALEGLDWKIAGELPVGISHSIFQLLNHIVYWQEWAVRWLDGEKPPVPRHASGSWPGPTGPANSKEWKQAVRRLGRALDDLTRHCVEGDLHSKRGGKSRMEMLQVIASHSSYHIGQLVQLRQLLGAWPPPSGGVTW